MKNLWKLQVTLAVVLVALMMAFTTNAWATNVVIANNSFETPTLAVGLYTNSVVGWTLAPNSFGGTQNLPSSYVTGGKPDGPNSAWLHTGSLSQVLNDYVQANHEYTLGVYVNRVVGTPSYSIQLVARDIHGADHLLVQTTPGSMASYRRYDYIELDYTATSYFLGDQLKIILSSSGSENDFDLVTLKDNTLVPLPSTLLLMGSGLVGLTFLRRRRKYHK